MHQYSQHYKKSNYICCIIKLGIDWSLSSNPAASNLQPGCRCPCPQQYGHSAGRSHPIHLPTSAGSEVWLATTHKWLRHSGIWFRQYAVLQWKWNYFQYREGIRMQPEYQNLWHKYEYYSKNYFPLLFSPWPKPSSQELHSKISIHFSK